jgi:hypothetical protein
MTCRFASVKVLAFVQVDHRGMWCVLGTWCRGVPDVGAVVVCSG